MGESRSSVNLYRCRMCVGDGELVSRRYNRDAAVNVGSKAGISVAGVGQEDDSARLLVKDLLYMMIGLLPTLAQVIRRAGDIMICPPLIGAGASLSFSYLASTVSAAWQHEAAPPRIAKIYRFTSGLLTIPEF